MAQLSNLPNMQSLCKNSAISNAAITSIKNEIINVLQLENKENKDKIVNDLLQNGRQSLIKYQVDIVPSIYIEVMDRNNQLLNLLKHYFQQHWEIPELGRVLALYLE